MLTVAGRIRKNTEARIFALEALAVGWSFTFAAFRPGQSSWLDDPWMILRMAIPTVAALAALLLRDGWASAEDGAQFAPMLDVSMAYAAAALTQPLVRAFWPELALPRWAPTEGGIVGPLFLTFVRALFPPRGRVRSLEAVGLPASVAELRWRVEEFGREIRMKNVVTGVAVAAMGALGIRFVLSGTGRIRASFGIILAGVAYVVYQFLRRGLPRKAPAGGSFDDYYGFYRGELERQLVFHLRVGEWLYGSLAPGCALLILGTRIYDFILVLVVLLIAELNHRAEEKLDRELVGLALYPRVSSCN